MRILALTFGDANQGSTRFRIHQYVEPLREHGIELVPARADEWTDWKAVRQFDGVLVQKRLLSVGRIRLLRRASRRLIYDVDDAIWHPHSRRHSWLTRLRTNLRLRAITSAADLVVAANQVLAAHLRRWSRKMEVLPMSLDARTWVPRSGRDAGALVRIGWAGSPGNHAYLEALQPLLLEIRRRHSEVEFVIFSGQKPRLGDLPYRFEPFDPHREPEVIRSFDIGLLPLLQGPFAEGKSPIKGLHYMASGVATVASPVGATCEMFEDGRTAIFARQGREWVEGLEKLIANPAKRLGMGALARREFEERYSLQKNVPRLADLLRSASGTSCPPASCQSNKSLISTPKPESR